MPPSEAAEPADSPAVREAYRWFPAAVILYYALHTALRTALGGGAGLDDAEQIVATQVWALGYGPQPPLFTWLQKPLFDLFGINVFAFAVLRNVILAATVLTVFVIGRRLGGPRLGALAAASLMLVPQFAWESQRAHTHTALVVLIDALAVLVFLDLIERGRTWSYAIFGALSGLTFLAKANGVILPGALLAAGLFFRESRAAILDWRILLVPVAAVAVAGLPAWWMLGNRDLVMARAAKFGVAAGGGTLEGALALAERIGSFLALLVLAWAALSGGRVARLSPQGRLLAVAVLLALAAILIGITMTGTTRMKERWLQPVLFLAPVLAAAWCEPRLSAARERWFWRLIATLGSVVLVMIPVHHFYGGFEDPPIKNADFAELLDRIEVRHGPVGTVLADGWPLAGNLRMLDPGLTVVVPQYPLPGLELPKPWVAAWRTDDRKTKSMPDGLDALLAERGVVANPPDNSPVALPWTWPFSGAYSVQTATVSDPSGQR